MQIVKLKTKYLANLELEVIQRRNRLRATIAYFGAGLLLVGILLLTGCSTTQTGPMTHVAVQQAVALTEMFALDAHPEATPFVKVGTELVCSWANGTNADGAVIVLALDQAGVTNPVTREIINSGLAVFYVATAGFTNQTAIQPWAKDICIGLRNGVPSTAAAMHRATMGRNAPSMIKSPHLR